MVEIWNLNSQTKTKQNKTKFGRSSRVDKYGENRERGRERERERELLKLERAKNDSQLFTPS